MVGGGAALSCRVAVKVLLREWSFLMDVRGRATKRKEQPLQRPWGGKVKDMGSQDTIAEEVVGRQAWIGSRAHSLIGKAKPSVFTWS